MALNHVKKEMLKIREMQIKNYTDFKTGVISCTVSRMPKDKKNKMDISQRTDSEVKKN